MADAVTAEAKAAHRVRSDYAEQRLFDLSPFNTWVTGGLLYGLLIGTYALAARLGHLDWVRVTKTGPELAPAPRLALVLSLIICLVLVLQRWSQGREDADVENFARALKPGARWSTSVSAPKLRTYTLMGFAIGLIVPVMMMRSAEGRDVHPAVIAWFAVVSVLLGALFFRGLELTGSAARQTRAVIRDDVVIDLLQIERLFPWGRAAGRTSIVWFAVSAATLLLFVGNGFTLMTMIIMAGCFGMGVWTFVHTLSSMHHRIQAAKTLELDRLRARITVLQARVETDPAAAAQLTALVAYEARIDAAPEWPFDQTIAVRVGVSGLILMVPWFGQAVAGLVVEHVGKVLH